MKNHINLYKVFKEEQVKGKSKEENNFIKYIEEEFLLNVLKTFSNYIINPNSIGNHIICKKAKNIIFLKPMHTHTLNT